MRLWMQIVLQLVVGALTFLRREKERASRAAAVRSDPGSAWLRRFGGQDRRSDNAGSHDSGSHCD